MRYLRPFCSRQLTPSPQHDITHAVKAKQTTKNDLTLSIRLPRETHARLGEVAAQQRRSLNGQSVFLIEEHLTTVPEAEEAAAA